MPARTTSVADVLPKIFDQVQTTSANHQKNVVALHKLHLDAAAFTESTHGGRSIKLTGERLFEDTFIDLLCRVIVVKKGISQADRIIKFVGAYIHYLDAKARGVKKEDDNVDDDDDTTTTRFVVRLLKFLLKGFVAKDKIVRYRCVHLLTEMVAHLGEIDEDIYYILRAALMERIHDKETPIRVQAAVALSKLCGSEDPSDVEEGEQAAIDVLFDTLSCDPAAEVRRAALLNIPIAKHTLPCILARSRDTDTVMRRLVYSAVLEKNCTTPDGSVMGPLHPRVLAISQRELIVRNGLGDREPAVRSAAGSLLGAWVDVVRGSTKAEEGGSVMDDVLAFLGLFDLNENTVAEDALLSIFATRVDIFDQLELKDAFWDTLNPEKAFLGRVYMEHCIATDDQAKLEASLPVVTHLAYQIEGVYNKYQEDVDTVSQERALRELDANERPGHDLDEPLDDILLDAEFVISEMLKLAVNLDYADEIGRRKMFQFVRDTIGQEGLPEGLVARCLDVLRVLSPSERDLIRVVVEVVHELRDEREGQEDDGDEGRNIGEGQGDDGAEDDATASAVRAPKAPKPPKELTPEEQARADALDLRCLSLCIGMLERVNGTFEENSTLEGILGELIVPAVKRKELALREKGLVCLGLCCLIARRMALNSFQLFLSQVQSAPEVLKTRVLQIVFDMLMVHEADFLGKGGIGSERIIEFLLHVLSAEDAENVQALLCVGLSKLMLAGMVSDERVLKSLVVAYLSPDTAENQELRQCLAYFFPVYCYSSSINQKRMRQISISIFEQLAEATHDLDDDQEMVSSAQIIGMFADWTDPQKAVEVQGQTIDDGVHLDLAEDILKTLFKDDMQKEDKKVLCQILGRLHLPDKVDDDKIRTIKLLVHNVFTRRPIRDVSARNALTKFDTTISKKYADKLAGFSEEEYRRLEQLDALFKFLDDIVPLDDGEEMEPPRTRGRKRRSESVMTESSVAEDGSVGSAQSKGKGKQTKRRRVSGSGDEDEEDDDVPEGEVTPAPTRTLPKRAASVKKAIPLQNISDDDDDDDGEEEATPAPKRGGRARYSMGGNATFDSIMDSEEEEEEED
ncbi:nuclear condensing complex subunit [Boletus edulis BED1]|uniref:Nuclear condensing complex subunit n=1 Tax=Boletus edulis BED1 TaxID=1328754 RepID=A0AAD4BF56_BOLED|nr:nuclear condensing complex subunit [Boletus edulis BED1]